MVLFIFLCDKLFSLCQYNNDKIRLRYTRKKNEQLRSLCSENNSAISVFYVCFCMCCVLFSLIPFDQLRFRFFFGDRVCGTKTVWQGISSQHCRWKHWKMNEWLGEQSKLLVVVYVLWYVVCYVKLQRMKWLTSFVFGPNGRHTVTKLWTESAYRQSNGLIEEKQWKSTANRKVLMRIAFIHMKNCWLVWFQCQRKTSIF